MTEMTFDIGTVDKLIMHFVTFQGLIRTYTINCSDLIVVVFMDVNSGI